MQLVGTGIVDPDHVGMEFFGLARSEISTCDPEPVLDRET
jgi:hypothetical protein